MWTKPWGYREGLAVGLGLLAVGTMLQLSIGSISWSLFAFPVNILFLAFYVLILIALFALRRRVYFVRWLMSWQCALPAIFFAAIATIEYGITSDRSTLSAWPFGLLYMWLTTILGLLSLKRWRSPAFLLNHLGLFIAIISATLGTADIQKLKMMVRQGEPEWRAVAEDGSGAVVELDVAIKLNHFSIEEYPPKLMVISNETGKTLPIGRPEVMVVDDSVMTGRLLGHVIKVERMLPYCAQFIGADTVNYVPWSYNGATTAALVAVDGRKPEWVCNGSYMFPYRPVRIDKDMSLVMPECEPKRFTSNVDVYTKSGLCLKNVDVEVNKPLEADGWKIYQLSYDDTKGRWSDISVFELVRDPWLPFVYLGIFMLLGCALWMFVTAGGKKNDRLE